MDRVIWSPLRIELMFIAIEVLEVIKAQLLKFKKFHS